MTDPQSLVLREVREGVGVISLNRPKLHNAISNAMRLAITESLEWADKSPDVGAILLRGEGPSFCSGRDLAELGSDDGDTIEDRILKVQNMKRRQLGLSKPVIVALHGHVIGAGLELAGCADIRIAAADAKMSVPEVAHGLTTDSGSSYILPPLIGPARAKWLIMSGSVVTAPEALQWGLVEWVLPDRDALDSHSFEVTKKLANLPREAVQRGKALVNANWIDGLEDGLRREHAHQSYLFRSEDYSRLRSERAARRAAS